MGGKELISKIFNRPLNQIILLQAEDIVRCFASV